MTPYLGTVPVTLRKRINHQLHIFKHFENGKIARFQALRAMPNRTFSHTLPSCAHRRRENCLRRGAVPAKFKTAPKTSLLLMERFVLAMDQIAFGHGAFLFLHGAFSLRSCWGSETPILGRSNPHAGEIADLRRGEALPMPSEHEVRPVAAPCAAADHSADGLLHFQLSKIEPRCAIATRRCLNGNY